MKPVWIVLTLVGCLLLPPAAGANSDGINQDGLYPGSAIRDSFAMRSPAQVRLADLDPASIYNVKLFSSTDSSRQMHWTINGETKVSADPFNNLWEFTLFSGVSPDAQGNLLIDADDAGHTGYWSVLEIELIPEPSTLVGLLTLAITGLAFYPRRKR